MRHDILDLPSIPRDAKQLRALVGQARYRKRRSNLTRFAAYNLIIWALIVCCMRVWPHTPAHAVPLIHSTKVIYLPSVIGYNINSNREITR